MECLPPARLDADFHCAQISPNVSLNDDPECQRSEDQVQSEMKKLINNILLTTVGI